MENVLVLTCLCLIGVSRINGLYSNSGVSVKILDFTSFYNGRFDNIHQTRQNGDNHILIEASFVPVKLECFHPKQAFYMKKVVNGVTQFRGVGVVTDGIQDIVLVDIYKFKNASEHDLENLPNIPCDEYKDDPQCVAAFHVNTAEGYVFGNVPNCERAVNGEYPRFASVHTCTSATMAMPSPIEPFAFRITSVKYPMINTPPGYKAPCDKGS